MNTPMEQEVRRGRGRPPGRVSTSTNRSVKIDEDLALRAKTIADHQHTTVAALLSGMLEQPIYRAYREMIREIDEKAGLRNGTP